MNAQVLDIIENLRGREGQIHIDDMPEEFSVIEDGDWINEGKYELRQCIVKHTPSDTYWEICSDRSGSYYTDWYYGRAEITQVEPKEETVVITKWVVV